MDIKVKPRRLEGEVQAIPSKSHAHRLLILAALAHAPTEMELAQSSVDIETTIACLQAMGADIERSGGSITVKPISRCHPNPGLNCRESGSTLRFLLPVAAAFCGDACFSAGGELPERPLADLAAALERQGVMFSRGKLPFAISGKLLPGDFRLPGDVSSQYVSGLLMALPLLPGKSTIHIEGRLESSPYVEMTLAALRLFGITVDVSEGRFDIEGGQRYISPGRVKVEGDWSNAAFFLAAGALGGPVTVRGLDRTSVQGDKAIVPILEHFGAPVNAEGDSITVSSGELRACSLDLRDTPDLLPVLAVVAAYAEGRTEFTGCERLRFKESDRIISTAVLISDLLGGVVETDEGLLVYGEGLAGGTADSFMDHRIAMAAAVAALRSEAPVTILDAHVVEKSYPAFFDHYRELGGAALGI